MGASWEEASFDDVRNEWRAFRHGLPAGLRVRQPIVRSWERSRAAGVTERAPGGRMHPVDCLRSAHQELWTAATPVLTGLAESLRESGLILVFCDPSARALVVDGDMTALRRADRINLVAGSDWSEAVSGTNAMGTALVEAQPTTVLSVEHYLEDFHPWSCVAIPILHPVTGKVMGVLDLSGPDIRLNHHVGIAARSAVQAIEAQLAAREANLQKRLLAALADRLAVQRHGGIGVIDRHGQLLQFIGGQPPHPSLWSPMMERLLQEQGTITDENETVRLTYQPVRWEGEIVGALVESTRPEGHHPPPAAKPLLTGVVGRDPRWLAALERAARAARTDATVLITGETGTGKEVVARAIHHDSARSDGPFVAINCGALPPALAASQLLGYIGGAFTGANPRGAAGAFEMAQHGTLFLDEVSELSPEGQVALLRVLQEREVVRVGTHRPIKVDVRLIAASNRDLPDMVARGLFRQDLFFRLNVLPVSLPPLRERPQDIIPLVAHGFQRLGVEPPPLPPSSWQHLLQHRWPGNVRELLNLVEQAVALNEDPADLLPLPSLLSTPVVAATEDGEEDQIRRALDQHQGNAAAAARALGIGRSTLYRKLEVYGIRLKRQIE